MTDTLQTLTRKRLAALARSRRVPGWHEMRKADLIQALKAQPDENDPSAFPATFPLPHEEGASSDVWRAGSPAGMQGGHRSVVFRPLLQATERDDDQFTARAVTPHWIRAAWSLSNKTLARTHTALGVARLKAEPVLRLYEVAGDERLTHSVTHVADIRIAADSHEWYVPIERAGGVYQLHLGILTQQGDFHRLIGSERIDIAELTCRPTSQVALPPAAEALGNGHVPPGRTTIIPLAVQAELLIRGTTHPQAVMSVGTESLPVEADGSFHYCRPLTDGRHVIPTTALSPDGRRQHTVVIALECNTKYLTPLGTDEM